MSIEKHQNKIYWALIASETSHVFCCVLPTIFSVLSLLAGLGLITAVPSFLVDFHAMMHRWELPVIVFSGIILALGWALQRHSRKIDCHDTGCHHPPCGPAKRKASKILVVATILFVVNVSIYLVFHRGMQMFVPEGSVAPVSTEAYHHH